MKRISLALALAALSVPVAAAAAQTSQPATSGKASVGKVKIYGTVKAIGTTTVTVANAARTRIFVRRAVSLAGIHTGSRVEAEGFVRNGKLRLSGIHLDDHLAATTGATSTVTTPAVDDKGGQTASNDDAPGDDRGGHGQDDGPGHS